MPQTTERMRKLQQMLERDPDDPFLLYALALEHKKLGGYAESLKLLARVVKKDPGCCAAYQQAAQVHELAGDLDAARKAYRDGIAAAAQKGDEHAREEMRAALTMLE